MSEATSSFVLQSKAYIWIHVRRSLAIAALSGKHAIPDHTESSFLAGSSCSHFRPNRCLIDADACFAASKFLPEDHTSCNICYTCPKLELELPITTDRSLHVHLKYFKMWHLSPVLNRCAAICCLCCRGLQHACRLS